MKTLRETSGADRDAFYMIRYERFLGAEHLMSRLTDSIC